MAKNANKSTDNAAKNLGGRPPQFATPEDFETAVDAFIADCKATSTFPDDFLFHDTLHISQRTEERYREDKDKEGYGDALKKLYEYREHLLQEQLLDPFRKSTGGPAFALKQIKNGGWTDRQQIDAGGALALNVSISGASGASFEPDKTDK